MKIEWEKTDAANGETNKDEANDKTKGGDNEIKGIADSILNTLPPVSEHVIEQEQNKQVTDAEGVVFDPALHVADANGNPVKTAAGLYRNKSGRKSAGRPYVDPTKRKPAKSQLNISGTDNAPAPELAPGTVMAGKAAAALIFQAGLIIGGDEWQPVINESIGRNEPLEMETAWINYFKAKGITDFPPGVVLALTMVSYAVPRFAQPKTKTRFQMIGLWIKSKIPTRKKATEKAPEMPEEKKAVG